MRNQFVFVNVFLVAVLVACGRVEDQDQENCVPPTTWNATYETCEQLTDSPSPDHKAEDPATETPATGSPASEVKPPKAGGVGVLPKSPYGFWNPIPGGVIRGYTEDSGLDIHSAPTPVYAVADADIVYSEEGHTKWTKGIDTANSILMILKKPFKYRNRMVTHVWYTHLSKLEFYVPDGGKMRSIKAGQKLGISGYGNATGHLHLGLLLEGNRTQKEGTHLSMEDVRLVLGYKQNEKLPN